MEPISNAQKTFFKHFASFHFFLNIISQPLLFCPIEKRVGNAIRDGLKKEVKKVIKQFAGSNSPCLQILILIWTPF
jgi:tRNA A37 N6-isopentenylltransferase MiaA